MKTKEATPKKRTVREQEVLELITIEKFLV